MDEAIISMLTVCINNLESSYYWLNRKETSANVEASRNVSMAEDLIRDAINVLQGAAKK